MNPDSSVLFHKRPLAGAALGATLGVLLGTLLSSVWVSIAIAVPFAVLGVIVVRKRIGWGLLLVLFAVLTVRSALIPKDSVTGDHTIIGVVAEQPTEKGKQTVVVLRDAEADGVRVRSRIQLYLPKSELQYGDTVRVTASLHKPRYRDTSAAEGIFSVGSGDAPEVLSHSDDAYGLLIRARKYYAALLDSMYGDRAGDAKAMLLGDRSDFSYDTTERYSKLGILHIFAVSGMHVTALIAVLGVLIRTGSRGVDLLLMTIATALYCALTSFAPSVLRAACYVFALRLPGVLDKQNDEPSAFCFSVAMVLLLRPYSLFTASFLLSFGAIAGIILIVPTIRELIRLPNIRLINAILSAIAVFIAVMPIEAYFFGGAAWMTIPMSVLIAPPMLVLMPFAFLSMLFAPFLPHIAQLLSLVPYGVFVYLDLLSEWIQGSTLALPAPHILVAVFWYGGLIFISPYYLNSVRRNRLIGLSMLVVATLLWLIL